jgi:hypothetical protein
LLLRLISRLLKLLLLDWLLHRILLLLLELLNGMLHRMLLLLQLRCVSGMLILLLLLQRLHRILLLLLLLHRILLLLLLLHRILLLLHRILLLLRIELRARGAVRLRLHGFAFYRVLNGREIPSKGITHPPFAKLGAVAANCRLQ